MPWPPPHYYPDRGNGYRLRLEELRRLVAKSEYRSAVAPLLKCWFDYDILGEGENAAVLKPNGDVVTLDVLHDQIQSDPEKQYYLYQCAMNFWR